MIADIHDELEFVKNQNKKLTADMQQMSETLQHREHFIDWILEHHPEVINEYLEQKSL